MILNIKNMVSFRCKMLVKTELDKLGLHYGCVDLGEVFINEEITAEQYRRLKYGLFQLGLELMDDKKNILIERIKNTVVQMVHYTEEAPKTKNSTFISDKLNHDYTYLANVFSQGTGTTIEHYIINQKIERVKELMCYNELNLSEIAWKLNYSSVAHLSNQFKKVTGLTPSYFKSQKGKRRTIENVCNKGINNLPVYN